MYTTQESEITRSSFFTTQENGNETIVNSSNAMYITSEAPTNITNSSSHPRYDIIHNEAVQALFCVLYTTIFVLGVFGNVLVCYVVGRNRAMQTVTNFFITNLALSDILLCVLAVPFTPLYTFIGQWVFGSVLCHIVACAQGTSVYISTLTLTAIAIDRFLVIIYPFQQRMQLSTCLIIICLIWFFSLLLTLPYGLYISHKYNGGIYYCDENWPSEKFRVVYGSCTASMQFLIPFLIIAFCYVRVSLKLNDRARSKPGTKNSRKEEADRERKRRTNRMLIAMVTIFGVSWLPLNVINVMNDVYIPTSTWEYYNFVFFIVHAIAMSSTCYNPFLYAWLNENFRKEFKQVLPCFDPSAGRGAGSGSAGRPGCRTCNGNETMQETLLHTSIIHRCGSVRLQMPDNANQEEDASPCSQQSDDKKLSSGDGKCKAVKEDSVDMETVMIPTATYSAIDDSVQLYATTSFDKTSPPICRNHRKDARPMLPLATIMAENH